MVAVAAAAARVDALSPACARVGRHAARAVAASQGTTPLPSTSARDAAGHRAARAMTSSVSCLAYGSDVNAADRCDMSTSSANALRNSRASSGPPRRLASKSLRIHTRSARASPRDASAAFASSDPFPAAAPAPLSAPKKLTGSASTSSAARRSTARCEGTYASLAGWRDTAAASAANTAVAVGSRARGASRGTAFRIAPRRDATCDFSRNDALDSNASESERRHAYAAALVDSSPHASAAHASDNTPHATKSLGSTAPTERALRAKGRTHAGSYPAAGAGPAPSSGVESDPSSAETSPRSEGGGAGTPRACGNLTAVAAHRRASSGAPPRSAAAMDSAAAARLSSASSSSADVDPDARRIAARVRTKYDTDSPQR